MELAPGKPLDSVNEQEAAAFLLPNTLQVINSQVVLTSTKITSPEDACNIVECNKRLREVGKLVALDILCNNWDRIPLLWPNEGNVHNIFFDPREGVFGIDNTVCPIPAGPKVVS